MLHSPAAGGDRGDVLGLTGTGDDGMSYGGGNVRDGSPDENKGSPVGCPCCVQNGGTGYGAASGRGAGESV